MGIEHLTHLKLRLSDFYFMHILVVYRLLVKHSTRYSEGPEFTAIPVGICRHSQRGQRKDQRLWDVQHHAAALPHGGGASPPLRAKPGTASQQVIYQS